MGESGGRCQKALRPSREASIRHFEGNLFPDAVRIFTPFANRVPVGSCNLTRPMAEFLAHYEPKILSHGVFPHQAEFFEAYKSGGENFIVTTATGSGKSLCFWSWVFDCLCRQPGSTALLCFPTQALMLGAGRAIDTPFRSGYARLSWRTK